MAAGIGKNVAFSNEWARKAKDNVKGRGGEWVFFGDKHAIR